MDLGSVTVVFFTSSSKVVFVRTEIAILDFYQQQW